MEALEDSNCHSMSGSFALYERFMRSFSVAEEDQQIKREGTDPSQMTSSFNEFENVGYDPERTDVAREVNKYRSSLDEHYIIDETTQHCDIIDERSYVSSVHSVESCLNTMADSSLSMEQSIPTGENSFLDKSDGVDATMSSEDTKSNHSIRSKIYPKPVVITSLTAMENSNNAVDGVPLFKEQQSDVFKLPITELSFNGAIKHVQRLMPILDPMTESANTETDKNVMVDDSETDSRQSSDVTDEKTSEFPSDEGTQSTGDSQYKEFHSKNTDDETSLKSSMEQSNSSMEASFDSGVRSPDMFEDESDEEDPVESVWEFIKKYEVEEMARVKKMEEKMRGIPPPPSVTLLRTNVTEMLKKYYSFLPAFTNTPPEVITTDANLATPTKGVSYVRIPLDTKIVPIKLALSENGVNYVESEQIVPEHSSNELGDVIKIGTEVEAKESGWPDVLKCTFHDIHYNITSYSERVEQLTMKCSARYVGAETASSVTVYSESLPSPSSAGKRKALRMKLAQGKSPGRRLSHLARRRQTFCSAATISGKAQASTSKMVLIDKNYFPHKKLTYTSEYKNTRLKRTPRRKTPGKKTPAKTPSRSGEGSRKKAMRRLLMEPEALSRSQPVEKSYKRALFISPDNRNKIVEAPLTSVPQVFKSRRALFGSPSKTAETKSLDGTPSDNFLKRKRDSSDNDDEIKSKIPKSLSFSCDTFGNSQASQSFTRRASELIAFRTTAELNELHKKKLLWAVSEALRIHGWRMGAPGFRERASALARLTRRLLSLPPHAAKLANPRLSTSETMLKLARQYVFAIIQGRSVDDCFQEEQLKLANDNKAKVSGYISDATYQQMKVKNASVSKIKENSCNSLSKSDGQRSSNKNVLQDKLVNIDSNSNSSTSFSSIDKTALFKSNSMPSFNDSAKMRARRQITFDNIDLPKR